MTVKRRRLMAAVTLVEIMVAMVILTIAALSALGYQYHAARHSKVAMAQVIGARTAQLLLEDWKSTGGSENYDPTTLNLGFSSVMPEVAQAPLDGGALIHGLYTITVEDIQVVVGLNYKDVAHDSLAQITLRQLQVVACVGGVSEIYQPFSSKLSSYMDSSLHVSPIALATYIRLDASGG